MQGGFRSREPVVQVISLEQAKREPKSQRPFVIVPYRDDASKIRSGHLKEFVKTFKAWKGINVVIGNNSKTAVGSIVELYSTSVVISHIEPMSHSFS
jgi:hypothetical protein